MQLFKIAPLPNYLESVPGLRLWVGCGHWTPFSIGRMSEGMLNWAGALTANDFFCVLSCQNIKHHKYHHMTLLCRYLVASNQLDLIPIHNFVQVVWIKPNIRIRWHPGFRNACEVKWAVWCVYLHRPSLQGRYIDINCISMCTSCK